MSHFGGFATNRCLPKFTELDISQNSCGLFGRASAYFIFLHSKLIGQFGIIHRISYWGWREVSVSVFLVDGNCSRPSLELIPVKECWNVSFLCWFYVCGLENSKWIGFLVTLTAPGAFINLSSSRGALTFAQYFGVRRLAQGRFNGRLHVKLLELFVWIINRPFYSAGSALLAIKYLAKLCHEKIRTRTWN